MKKCLYNTEDNPVIVQKTRLAAIRKYLDWIAPTYGPTGKKTLIVHNEFNIEAVDDAKRSVQAFELEDEFENAVISEVKETTEKGKDGTNTAGILMGNIVIEAFSDLDDGFARKDYHGMVISLKKGVEEAVKQIKKVSKSIKTKEELEAIAYNSYNNEDIAKLIANTVHEIGKDGKLDISDSKSTETTVSSIDFISYPLPYPQPLHSPMSSMRLLSAILYW